MPNDLEALAALLSGAGFAAAEEEADELLACAAGDVELPDSLVGRRLTGEPLAWITGSVPFCGLEIRVDLGVYIPRWQSEPLARRAVERLTNERCGDLFAPLPHTLEGRVDVVVGVVPYVPTPELPLLQRDTFTFESPLSYDGGRDGTEILRRVLTDSPRFLRRGGALLLELGDDLARLGHVDVTVLVDEDSDVRGIEATLGQQ